MSRKSNNRKKSAESELANAPDTSIAGLIRASAPELAVDLNPKVLRELANRPVGEIVAHQITTTMWGGPIPPPEHLAQYEAVVPGAANRILTMAEKQAEHRQRLESYAVPAQHMQSARGQIFALVIGITAILGAVGCAALGQAAVGSALAVTGLGTLAVSFITGKWTQKQQLEKKAETKKLPTKKAD